jgi:hypothetical protein
VRKTLTRLQKEEEKIYKKLLTTKDSVIAKIQIEEINKRYQALQQKIKSPIDKAPAIRNYVPQLDTLNSALKFLNGLSANDNVKDALAKVESFNGNSSKLKK